MSTVKYHVSPTSGKPEKCGANKKPCPLGGEHFATAAEANVAIEKQAAAEASNEFGTVEDKKDTSYLEDTLKAANRSDFTQHESVPGFEGGFYADYERYEDDFKTDEAKEHAIEVLGQYHNGLSEFYGEDDDAYAEAGDRIAKALAEGKPLPSDKELRDLRTVKGAGDDRVVLRTGGEHVKTRQWVDKDGKLHSENDEPAEVQDFGHYSVETYCEHGEKYRASGPAEVVRDENGQIRIEKYYKKPGVLHNEDGPARIVYDENGRVEQEVFMANGAERTDVPAVITYDEDGSFTEYAKTFGDGGDPRYPLIPDDGGPSVVRYDKDGNVERMEYANMNRHDYHREDGPAVTEFYPSGKVKQELWFVNGRSRNLSGGPRQIIYAEDGTILEEYDL